MGDCSVGGLPSQWGWSYTAIPTQSSHVTGKGMAALTGLSMGLGLSDQAVAHGPSGPSKSLEYRVLR